jgi:hypothetical protein
MRALSVRPEDGPTVLKEILENLPSFWGERDMRAQHQPVWLRQFARHLALHDGSQTGSSVVRDSEIVAMVSVNAVWRSTS